MAHRSMRRGKSILQGSARCTDPSSWRAAYTWSSANPQHITSPFITEIESLLLTQDGRAVRWKKAFDLATKRPDQHQTTVLEIGLERKVRPARAVPSVRHQTEDWLGATGYALLAGYRVQRQLICGSGPAQAMPRTADIVEQQADKPETNELRWPRPMRSTHPRKKF